MGHLNNFLALGAGNFNKNFPKIQMPGGLSGGGGGGGMFKLRFDWYITVNHTVVWEPRESIRRINNTADLLLYKIVFMLRFGDIGDLSLMWLGKNK